MKSGGSALTWTFDQVRTSGPATDVTFPGNAALARVRRSGSHQQLAFAQSHQAPGHMTTSGFLKNAKC